jgi:hypothetical protein
LSEDVVDDTSTYGGRHSGRPNYAGSEDATHNRRYVHLAPSMTPLEPRASCGAVATCTSGGAACSPAFGVPPPRCPGDTAACPHRGPPSLALWMVSCLHRPGNRRHYSGSRNRGHRMSGSGSRGHRIHRPWVRVARALRQSLPLHAPGWASSLMNQDGT